MTALDDQLAAARPGETVTLAKQTFDREWTLHVPDGVTLDGGLSTLRFASDGADIETDPREKNRDFFLRNRSHVRLGQGATVRRLRVEGANPAAEYHSDREAQAGFECSGGNTLEECSVEYVFGDGFMTNGVDNVIRNFVVHGTGRMGIGYTNGRGLLVEDGTLDHLSRSVIDVEPVDHASGTFTEEVVGGTFRRLQVGTYGISLGGGGAVLAGLGSGMFSDILCEDITMTVGRFPVLVGATVEHRRRNVTFRRCRSAVGARWNLPTYTFKSVDGVLIEECYQEFGGKGAIPAVKAVDCTGVVLTGNQFPGATIAVATA